MIRAKVKCKNTFPNSEDTFPVEFPDIPSVGQWIISLEEHFFEIKEVIWSTNKFHKAELIVNVIPLKATLCG